MGETAKFAFDEMKNRVPEFQMLTSIMGCRCQMIKRINETQLKINAFPAGPICQFKIEIQNTLLLCGAFEGRHTFHTCPSPMPPLPNNGYQACPDTEVYVWSD